MTKGFFSPKEKSVLQDDGWIGTGQESDGSFNVWKYRIKQKIIPLIDDFRLLMKFKDWIELDAYIRTYCKDDLIEIRNQIIQMFPDEPIPVSLITKSCNQEIKQEIHEFLVNDADIDVSDLLKRIYDSMEE